MSNLYLFYRKLLEVSLLTKVCLDLDPTSFSKFKVIVKKKLHSSCLCHILLWKMIKSKKLIQRLYLPEIMSCIEFWSLEEKRFSNREYLGYNIFSVGVSIVSLITVPQLTIVHCTPTRNIFLTTTCIYIMTHLLYFKMIANHWVGGVLSPFLDQSVEILC